MKLDHLVRLISQQWAIEAEVLENWCQILDAKLSGLPLPDQLISIEEKISSGRSASRSDEESFIRDGNIAIVPVVGTLVKANTLFSCDATYGDLRRSVSAAEKAKGIDAIILDGDTPGGTVAGVQEAGDFLTKVGQRKPLYGWVDDLAASAGYWLLSQTRMIGAHAAADIGSIGVLTVNYDRSGRDEQNGVKRTVLAVGDYKAAGNDTAPLTSDEQAYIMDRLEQTYGLFISAVGKGRPQLSADKIREMQSRVYKAAQAQKLGLIDHVMGRDEYIDYVKRQTRGAVTVPVKGVRAMKIEELKAEHPDLLAQIEAAAREGMITSADHVTALATARTEAGTATRTSLLGLHSAIFGEEAGIRFAAAAESGITADQAKALGITAETGDAAAKASILEGLTAVAPTGLRPGQIVQQQKAAIDTSAIYSARQARK
ncbi:MAG: S49 family peptidase [Geobacter sp.]|nr:MAG: S49 family peptidase [Geobacter sp.]